MGCMPCKGTSTLGGKLLSQILRAKYTPLRNNPGDQFRRCHIERWIVDRNSGWCDGMAAMNGSDF
jgi:hypothetical protein